MPLLRIIKATSWDLINIRTTKDIYRIMQKQLNQMELLGKNYPIQISMLGTPILLPT